MYRIALPVLLAAVTVAFPASALDVTADQSQPATEKPVKEKKVCKSDVSTGSIMAKRTCRTKAEWAAMEDQAKSDLDRMRQMDQSKSTVSSSRGQ